MQIKRLSLATFTGVIAEIFNKIAPLFILNIAQARLGIENFGMALYGVSVIEVAGSFVTFGYQHYGMVEVGKIHGSQSQKLPGFLAQVFSLRLMHAIAVISILLFMVFYLESFAQYSQLIAILSLALFFVAIDAVWVEVGIQKVAFYNFIMAFSKLLSFAAILWLVHSPQDMNLFSMLMLSANMLVYLLTFVHVYMQFPFKKPNFYSMKAIFLSSAPYSLVVIGAVLMEKLDVLLIERFFDHTDVAYFIGSHRISNSLLQIVNAMTMAFFAEMIKAQSEDEFSEYLNGSFWLFCSFFAPLCVGVWFVDEHLLTFILGGEFLSAGPILSLATAGTFGIAFTLSFGTQVLLPKGAMRSFVLCMFLGLLFIMVSILLSIYAQGGLFWATFGSAVAKIVTAIMIYFYCAKYSNIAIGKTIVSIAVPTLAMFFCLVLLDSSSFIGNILAGAASYIGAFYICNHKKILFFIQKLRG